jgi:hypothetical protein
MRLTGFEPEALKCQGESPLDIIAVLELMSLNKETVKPEKVSTGKFIFWG